MTDFTLYLDDSGSPKPSLGDTTPHFALGGILVNNNVEDSIIENVREFKGRWALGYDIPLHSTEIRSRKKNFSFLGKISEQERNLFFTGLTELIMESPFLVQACVVSRQGYHDRYFHVYGEHTWNMLDSALAIVLERCLKYVLAQQGTLRVVYEKMGKREDNLLESVFRKFREEGSPFDDTRSQQYNPLNQQAIIHTLRSIEGKSKKNELLQLADLCLYPVARSITHPQDQAYQALLVREKLIDFYVAEPRTEGIKFYCY